MTTQSTKPDKDLSILSIAYTLFDVVGGFDSQLETRGNRLRTYEAQRTFFTDEMYEALLSAFAGTTEIKSGGNPHSHWHKKTKKVFDHFFERFEELVFFLQRLSDIRLYEGCTFDATPYFFAVITLISRTIQLEKELILRSSPLIYLEACIYESKKNKFNLAITTRKLISERLHCLRQDKSISEFSIYRSLEKFDENKNAYRSLYFIHADVKSLRNELKDKASDSLTPDQNGLIHEIQGIYICMSALSRLKYYYPSNEAESFDVIQEFYNYFETAKEFEPVGVYFSRTGIPPYEIDAAMRIFLDVSAVISPHLEGYFHPSELLHNLDSRFGYLFIKLENLRKCDLGLIIELHKPVLKHYPSAQELIRALEHIKTGKKEESIDVISSFLAHIDSAPYSAQKLICVLYVGLTLSTGFKVTPNHFGKYINIYLSNTLPTTPLTVSLNDEHELIERFNKNKYDFNVGLIKIIGDYNSLIINSNLQDHNFVVNPLINIESFLADFLLNFENYKNEKNLKVRIKSSLKKLRTKLSKAKAPLIDFSVLDLKSYFIIDQLGLLHPEKSETLGYPAINEFLSLRNSTRTAILKECTKQLRKQV